ncbi:MAG: hypothetical protein ACI9GW_000805 [Halieaceae bacterium]|jgi:hypothetical protein
MSISIFSVRLQCIPILLCAALLLHSHPSHAELDLDTWDFLLESAVTDGEVEYRLLDNNPSFDALVEQIAQTDITGMTAPKKLVFYINAYNILAVHGILDGGSPESLLGRYFYFKRDTYRIAGDKITLFQLEHQWIRPLKEPRIHFAIVCASQSCPVLQRKAYRLDTLDEQLESATKEFINNPERNHFDNDKRLAKLSSIFKWFEDDFAEAAGSLQAYLSPLVENKVVAERLKNEAFQIEYLTYDWHLNGKR